MEDLNVYLVFHDMGCEGKELKGVFQHERDAAIFAGGAEAVHSALKVEKWTACGKDNVPIKGPQSPAILMSEMLKEIQKGRA